MEKMKLNIMFSTEEHVQLLKNRAENLKVFCISNIPIYAQAKDDLVIKIKNCEFTINAYCIPGIQLDLSFNDLLNNDFMILFDNDYLFLIKISS
ncbi:unnamed protein product [Debaryomyces tyrocola]|nr:unnamed protein product [Debaryomyces tyrocola]